MSRIKGKDTRPERVVRSLLRANGIRFTTNSKSLPGRPDIVLKDHAIALFIHGCFWHGHRRCKVFRMPKSNRKFWKNKIEANRKRDSKRISQLRKLGWKAVTIWECQLRRDALSTIEKVMRKAFQTM